MKINVLDIKRLDLNLAVIFVAIWQERSVTKAAARLALSQAATSAALARLREACGDPLFVRVRGGMAPTPRAQAMADRLEAGIADLWEVLTRQQAFDPSTASRRFSIGMSDDFEIALGPHLAKTVQRAGAQISVMFRQTNRHTVEQMLNDREIELAVVSGTMRRAWIAHEQIGQSGYACVIDAKAVRAPLPLSLDDYLAIPHSVFVNVVVASHYAHCFNSARGIRSGLSQTSSFNSQLRVERDQRCGLPALACA